MLLTDFLILNDQKVKVARTPGMQPFSMNQKLLQLLYELSKSMIGALRAYFCL